MSTQDRGDGAPDPDEQTEVLLVRVWRSDAGLRARVLRSGPREGWVPITLGVATTSAELRHVLDSWVREVSAAPGERSS